MRTSILFSTLLCLALVWAQNCSNPVQVGAYNLLQISFAPYKDRRLDAAIDYLNQVQDLSVLCIQELWSVDQRQEVITGLQGRYPHNHYAPAVQSTCNGGCSRSELDNIRNCISDNDCSLFSSNFKDCVYSNCQPQLESVGVSCATCLQAGDSVGDIFRNLDNCFSDDNANPADVCYAYEGQSDNLLLSTTPFEVTDVLYFSESPITVTTALYGRLNTSIGVTHVFCTHLLPADLPVFTFENVTNYNQSIQLLDWVNSKVGNASEAVMILGDFNHGPNYWPDNYDYVINSGYIDAYTSAGNTNCTYCDSNPLAMGDRSMIIDHIYLKNARQVSSVRFGTFEEYNLESIDIPFIDYNRIPISDHYGVRASVCEGSSNSAGVLSRSITVRDNDYIPERRDSSAEGLLTSVGLVVILVLCSL